MSDPQCSHGQLRRQCELCEKDEALAVAFHVLEEHRMKLTAANARIAEMERERYTACEKLGRIRSLLDHAEAEGWKHITIGGLRIALGETE